MFLQLFNWLERKLNRKYILGMTSGLIAISLLFFILFMGMYQSQLKTERSKTSLQINTLLQAALENAMVKRDLDGLRDIIASFAEQDEIHNIMILNTTGEVRLATQKHLTGEVYPTIGSAQNRHTTFINKNKSIGKKGEILRSINPIHNREACSECHDGADVSPINGVLVVDYDAGILRKNVRDTTMALMGAGSTVVLITLLGGWWFMAQFVLKPVHKLLHAQEQFSQGNLNTQVATKGGDELAQLSYSFNSMANTIETQVTTLERRKQFLQSLIDGIPDGVRVIDQDYNILLANQAYIEQYDKEGKITLQSKCYASHNRTEPCIPTLETCPLFEINKHNIPLKTIHHHISHQDKGQNVEIFAAPIENGEDWGKAPVIIEVIRDLSQSVKYSQEQRLSALGMLASGVAHEIHNPLGSIQMAFDSINQLIEQDEQPIDQLKVYMELVAGEVDKCVDITGRLLKLGNLPDSEPQPINLNMIITETLSLLNWEAKASHIEMKMDLPEPSLRVLATDSEMRMAILNLVQNAYHAMPNGGELLVSVKQVENNIAITIKDTGLGIPENLLGRIFDPFFSRRSDHKKGTGLGLSITKAIIERFNGNIQVSSETGKGSVFTINLPDIDKTEGLS